MFHSQSKGVRALALAVLIGAASLFAEELVELKVKAAFIYQFTKFIDWNAAPTGTFSISVVQDEAFADLLTEFTRDKKAKEFPIEVKNVANESLAKKSQIVVLRTQDDTALNKALASLKGCGCVVITDKKGAAERGATINFILVDDKVRFEVNRSIASREKLSISSQLLKLSTVIE